jgi:hypothetical protein
MGSLRSLPHGRDTDTAVDTSGTAVAIPDGSTDPFFPPTQVKIYVSALALIGWGPDNTPPTASATNTVYQEATTEVVYDIAFPSDATIDHLYIYAATGTVDYRVSFFG